MDWFFKNRNTIICPELVLTQERQTFNLLGVTFSTNINEMINLKYDPKIQEIKNLFAIWSKRIMSPIGRHIVIKLQLFPR